MPTLAELIAERERRRAVAASASGETVPTPPASGGVAMEALIAERERRRTGQPAPMPQPDVAPWGDGQAFDDLYARRPQKDPLLSPLRPDARTLTAGQSTQMKPPPAPRGPVMSPAQRRATQEERDAGRRDRLARDERTIFNSASPGLAFRDTGAQGTVELNTDGGDIGRGVIASPIHAQRAAVSAAEAMLNTPADLASVATVPFAMGMDPASQGIVANLEFARDEASVANAMDRFANRYEQGGFREMQEKLDAGPRFDFSAAKLSVPEDLQSLSGALAEGFMQYLIARGAVGKFAPGGKLPVQLAKDTAAVGVGYSGETGRAADMLDPETMGFMKDYVRWLQSQPGDSAGIGRFKNMAEDATINLLAMGLLRGGQAVTDTLTPQALTPVNAGGARLGPVNTAALQPPPTTAVPTFTRPQTAPPPVQPQAAAQAAQRAPTQPQVATAPPVAQTTPNAPAATVAPPQPVPVTGAAPPAGQLTPVPTLGPAEQAFNNLPMKTRESMLNAFQSAGIEANRAKAMISELNNLPDGQNTMYALEIMRRNGLTDADIDGVLIAMGREFATESPRPAGRVFNREQDSARQIMNDQVRAQINSEGRSITDVAERNFGQGVVPAGEALDLELDQLSNAYETILSTKRSPTGRLRSPAKKDAVYKAREELTNALVSPEVMQTIPPDVKLQIMMQASEDMRRLKFTPDELGLILQGDGKVLAPLFNGYGALSWSPDLWAHLARQYPTQAAHSLQSALRKAADEAFRRGDATWGRYYQRLRGESGKGGLLDTLERAVPKYRETRLKFGDASSAKEALDILERFKAAAASEGDVAKIIKDLEVLPQRHREMAEQQITSIVRQELARKVESPRLAELGQSVAQTPNLTSLSRQDFLKALEDVFGTRGKELADAIRAARARTDTLTSISPKYNSRTTVNDRDVQNAPALYEAPGSLEGGIIDAGVKRLGTVAGGASLIPGGQGAALALGAATAVQAAMNAARRGKRLSNAERNALVDFLFRSRTADDAAPAMATRGPSMSDYAQAIGRDAAIGAGVGAVADGDPLNNDPMALVGGAVGGAAGYGRARVRNARSLIKPPPAPRGAGRRNPPPAPRTPSGAPPVQSGFGGSPNRPMDEARAREIRGALWNHERADPKDLAVFLGMKRNASPEAVRAEAARLYKEAKQIGLAEAATKAKANNEAITREIIEMRARGVPDRMISSTVGLEDGALDEWIAMHPPSPSQASSSKLLAGTGATATGLGGAGGAVAGAALAPDTNGDGVIDAQERMAGGFGGLVSGLVGGGLAGAGANRLLGPRRGVSKAAPARRFRAPDQQTFAGVNAKTADKVALARAQKMEAEGASRDAIWDETGWFKGVDGKWRFEIDDSGAKLTGARSGALGSLMKHPELYKAYPDLGSAEGQIGGRGGKYIPPSQYNDEMIQAGSDDPLSVMLHEAGGHGVQNREGFARGGNPDMPEVRSVARSERDAALQNAQAINEKFHAEMRKFQDEYVSRYGLKGTPLDYKEAADEWRSQFPEKASAQDEAVRLMLGGAPDSYGAYRRLAGETEARNIQARDQMRRRGIKPGRPWETQDVPDDQQIVRFGSGKAESRPKAGPQTPRTGPGFGTEADYLRAVKEGDDAFRASAEKITQAGGFGDYKVSLRYPIDSELRGASFNVTKNGEVVGTFDLYSPGHTQELSLHAMVKPEFQRQGVATQFYDFVESTTGKRLRKSETMSPEGKALWDARERRSAPQKPPAQSGFGGGSPKPPPGSPPKAKPKAPSTIMGSAVGRAATGGVVGGAVGALAGEAGAQEDLTVEISETERTIAEIKKAMADLDKITDPFEKQRFLKDQGYYAGRIDGNIAGKTTEGMVAWKAKKEADLKKAEDERKDLVRRDALQSNRPDPLMMALREYGPAVFGIGALFGMKYMRGGAAKASIKTAEAASNKLNKLITKGPVTGALNKRDENRFANLNKLWQKGGASKDELPFKQDSAGKYKPNAKAKLPEELFADSGVWQTVTKYVKGKDVAIILGGGLDVAIAQPFIDKANENLKKAEAAWNDTPSDETAKALEDAKNEVAAYTLLQRIGMGVAGGRILGTFGGAYAKPMPNIPAAASEQAKLKQFIASQKPPPKPRAKAKPPVPKPKPKPKPKPPAPPVAPPTSQLPLPLKGGGKKKP